MNTLERLQQIRELALNLFDGEDTANHDGSVSALVAISPSFAAMI